MGTGDPSGTGVPNVTALMEALLLGIGVVGGSGVPVGVCPGWSKRPPLLSGRFLDGGLAFRTSHIGEAVAGWTWSAGVDVDVGGLGQADGLVLLGAGNAAGWLQEAARRLDDAAGGRGGEKGKWRGGVGLGPVG